MSSMKQGINDDDDDHHHSLQHNNDNASLNVTFHQNGQLDCSYFHPRNERLGAMLW